MLGVCLVCDEARAGRFADGWAGVCVLCIRYTTPREAGNLVAALCTGYRPISEAARIIHDARGRREIGITVRA